MPESRPKQSHINLKINTAKNDLGALSLPEEELKLSADEKAPMMSKPLESPSYVRALFRDTTADSPQSVTPPSSDDPMQPVPA